MQETTGARRRWTRLASEQLSLALGFPLACHRPHPRLSSVLRPRMSCGPSAICSFKPGEPRRNGCERRFPLRPDGRIPRAAKSPPSAVLRLTLQPARSSRVLVRIVSPSPRTSAAATTAVRNGSGAPAGTKSRSSARARAATSGATSASATSSSPRARPARPSGRRTTRLRRNARLRTDRALAQGPEAG
jgi:hypothetical protein